MARIIFGSPVARPSLGPVLLVGGGVTIFVVLWLSWLSHLQAATGAANDSTLEQQPEMAEVRRLLRQLGTRYGEPNLGTQPDHATAQQMLKRLRQLSVDTPAIENPKPVPPPRNDKPVHWKWPQPNAEEQRRYNEGFERWTTEWAKHRHDPEQYRDPGPPPFPQSLEEGGEWDRLQYETLLEVERRYRDRIEELETRLEKLERKITPPDYDDWPVVN